MFHVVDATPGGGVSKEFKDTLQSLKPETSKDFFLFVCLFIDMLNTGGHTAELILGNNGFRLIIDGVEFGKYIPPSNDLPINAFFDMLAKASALPQSPFLMKSMEIHGN